MYNAQQKQMHRCRKQTRGNQREAGKESKFREQDQETQTTVYKIDKEQEYIV